VLLKPACTVSCAAWESMSPSWKLDIKGRSCKQICCTDPMQLPAHPFPKVPVVHSLKRCQHLVLVWAPALGHAGCCRVPRCLAFVLLRACSVAAFSPCWFCAVVFMDLHTLTVVLLQALTGSYCHQQENCPFLLLFSCPLDVTFDLR